MNNMEIYNRVCITPEEAKKPIKGGRLNGFTDINPMWRIKTLTELFGPCGVGWKKKRTGCQFREGANGEVSVFVTVELTVKTEDGWSEPVEGSGGAMFVAKERNGLYTDDEAVKKAETDALGSAVKLLGFSADIYYEKDRDKYTATESEQETPEPEQVGFEAFCEYCGNMIKDHINQTGKPTTVEQIVFKSRETTGKVLCWDCLKQAKREQRVNAL